MLALSLRGPRLRCMRQRGAMATRAEPSGMSPRRSAERVKQELLQSYKVSRTLLHGHLAMEQLQGHWMTIPLFL
jgi:hypothetical protein